MSKLEELIAELCSNGVERKPLSDVCKFQNGFAFKSALFREEGEPILRITNIDGQQITTSDLKYISRDDYRENLDAYIVNEDDIVIAMSGATTGKIGINKTKKSFLLNQRVGKFIPNLDVLDNHFLYHYLLTKCDYFYNAAGGGAQPNLSTKTINELDVPVPPMEVQREIVHILDEFTLLSAELSAELQARKKQYEYYRDTLLEFDNKIPMVTLKDIATDIYRGAGIKRDQVTEEGIPCVRYGEIYTTYNTWFKDCVSHTKEEYVSSPKYFEHGDILFAITGESVEDIAKSVAYLGNEKCLAGGDIVVLKHKQNPRYLAHVLSTTYARQQKSKGKVKSKVVHSNVPSIENITIPLPPLEVQERYADVLDNFETICNDLSIGLPAEIEARQKQYEYYRDMLLTFAETGDSILTDRQTDRA